MEWRTNVKSRMAVANISVTTNVGVKQLAVVYQATDSLTMANRASVGPLCISFNFKMVFKEKFPLEYIKC